MLPVHPNDSFHITSFDVNRAINWDKNQIKVACNDFFFDRIKDLGSDLKVKL